MYTSIAQVVDLTESGLDSLIGTINHLKLVRRRSFLSISIYPTLSVDLFIFPYIFSADRNSRLPKPARLKLRRKPS